MNQELINQVRNSYFLGNYQKVLDIWQQTLEEDEYFNFIVARAMMAFRELKPNTQVQITKKPSQSLLDITDIVSKFMIPLIKPTRINLTIEEDRRLIDEGLKKMRESFDSKSQYAKTKQVVCAYLSINCCEANYALQLHLNQNDPFQAEVTFLQLVLCLRGGQFDLAGKKLAELKKFDDEDILTYLGQVYVFMYMGQPNETLRQINDTKDRFGDSAKLMNLMINTLIRSSQNKFEEALDLGTKLQQALIEKEQFSDRNEMEICLSNLIVLSEICGKQSMHQECANALQMINPGSQLLKVQQSKLAQVEKILSL